MKKLSLIILLFSTLMNAQQKYNDYTQLWNEVEQFEKDNLPKSANKIIAKIFNKAKKANNTPQVIKALLYQSKYALTLEENAQLSVVHQFEKEISESEFPTKNIMENIVANLYWQYFQQNRWKFYERTNTKDKVDEKDFRTWDLHTIFKEIHTHFQNSLQNGLLSQKTPIESFKTILQHTDKEENLRPTLYDFLANNALDFYKTGESNLAKPDYKFEIDDPQFLGDNTHFLNSDFSSKDSLSQERQALLLYKELTRFHQLNKSVNSLLDISFQRLDFVRSNARFNDKDEVYLNTLIELKEEYKALVYSTEIDYRIALEYQRLGNKYQVNIKNQLNENYHLKLKKAIGVCNRAIKKYPNSNGAKKCKNLKAEIENPNSNLTHENFIETKKESRLLVSYKNMDKLFFKIYKVHPATKDIIQKTYNKKKKLNYITRMKVEEHFSVSLKNENDYQQHTTEIILPKFPQGEYIILASDDPSFNNENSYSFSYIQATNIALIENNTNRTYKYQVVSRNTGKPLEGAKLHIYNVNTNRYNKKIDRTFTSDRNGFVNYKPNEQHNNVIIEVTHNDNHGTFRFYRLYESHRNEKNHEFNNNSIFIFTDRSIYRPSQTVYFKGIAVSQYENKSSVIVNKKVVVKLQDANYQEVKSLELTTNEFGSFSGEFILPNTGLTGHHEIIVNENKSSSFSLKKQRIYGSVGFSVEEYKRPKFSAEFKKITETIQLDDFVKITGIANAYAGSKVSDAKVVYRVKRQVQYPKWWYWYRPYSFNSEAQEIAHGQTTTDEKGEFEISFMAQPDKSVDKKDTPIFSYEIVADITDINGETRSTTTVVKVGYHTLTASITIEGKLDKKNKENKIVIDTKNLNGEFVPAKGIVKIYKLVAPEDVYRQRPWAAPDYQEISESRFRKLFPHDTYTSEDRTTNLKKGEIVFETKFDTNKEKEITIKKMKSWESGSYIAIVESKDRFGQKVTDKSIFEVFGATDKKVADKQLFSISLDKDNYKQGEKSKLKLGSASKDLSVVLHIEKDNKIVSTQIVHLSDEIKIISIPIAIEDLGGFAILYNFVNYNSYQSGTIPVSVPYPKTELEIETQTFRDKLQPGQEEIWRFKIKGPKGDKVVAEILSSMYDVSLDQFIEHNWNFQPIYHKHYYTSNRSNAGRSFGTQAFQTFQKTPDYLPVFHPIYDRMDWFGFRFGNNYYYGGIAGKVAGVKIRGTKSLKKADYRELDEVVVTESADMQSAPVPNEFKTSIEKPKSVDKLQEHTTDFSNIQIRTNFNETAFFFPHLTTDNEGNVSFEFTTPESLTKWKLQLLAHTKELNSAITSMETVTQKELMILPNPPRFLREGDKIEISSKISNLSNKKLNGEVVLQLFDAITNQSIDVNLVNTNGTQTFEVAAKANTSISWTLQIPNDVQTVQYKIIAKAGNYSDGEQNVLPVLSNRMMVTETLPMWVHSNQSKTFRLDKLKNNTSKTLKNHKLTLEVTSNPAWYAVQALPYLMEYPHECAEQTFSRYYANILASHIANSNPRIQQVFNQWKNSDALLSNLEKNQELKSLIIQETPWLRDAQSETEQKKRIALLFDLHKMKSEQKRSLRKLKQMQMNGGGFPWFKGSREPNRYITQHIVAGFGHLLKLDVIPSERDNGNEESVSNLLKSSISYLDTQILKDYNDLLENAEKLYANSKDKKADIAMFLKQNQTNHFQIHYLYTRSFFKDIKILKSSQKAVNYYTQQTYQYWNDYNLYTKGMIALISYRNNNSTTAKKVLASLRENSITNEELGMYWKENTNSYFWYQAPIETQALLIEAFAEVENDTETIDYLKIWLLKNKQTNQWKTTKATTEAVYALLLQGTNWLETTEFVTIKIGGKTINPLELEATKIEVGTGYYKTSWMNSEITPEMAEVTISKESKGIAWGALYWQYFENLDKITMAKTPLQLSKKLFLTSNEDRGEQLTEITDKTLLELGDLVRVRVELKVDRPMEFIHMKDMRASGFEPVNVISQYKWQDGLGYYESTKDASTNFFIDYLPKGIYVFEYDLRVNNKGDFSNGITTIQSMYAPEFSSHSEGIRVRIGE